MNFPLSNAKARSVLSETHEGENGNVYVHSCMYHDCSEIKCPGSTRDQFSLKQMNENVNTFGCITVQKLNVR